MKKIFFAPLGMFVVFVGFLIAFELFEERQSYYFVMESRARGILDTVAVYHKWAASVNRLYADTTTIKPNPLLEKRQIEDLILEDQSLTLINPSYMTNLVAEVMRKQNKYSLRMISELPASDIFKPNEWEKRGFNAFRNGDTHYKESNSNLFNEKSYRYMIPLYVQQQCHLCHEENEFINGTIVGGLSVDLPAGNVYAVMKADAIRNVIVYSAVLAFLVLVAYRLQQKIYAMTIHLKENINELNNEIGKREKSELALIGQARLASQGELLNMVAHHWRQPLNVVSLTFDYLYEHIEDTDKSNTNLLNDIDRSQAMLIDLSKTIDMFSDRFKNNDKKSYFSIASILMDTLTLIEPLIIAKHINFHLKCLCSKTYDGLHICRNSMSKNNKCEKIDETLFGSANDFQQILISLIRNAYDSVLESMTTDTENYAGAISIGTKIQNNIITITISDNGSGISEEAAEKIFEPYYTTKGFDYGKGTGLYFAKMTARNFKGGEVKLNKLKDPTEFIFTAVIEKA